MELLADGLFILAGFGAAFYCLILSRRIRRLSNLDSGLGAAIAGLSTQVEEMRRTLDSARSISGKTQKELTQMTARAEIAAGRLELLLVAVHTREDTESREKTPVFQRSANAKPSGKTTAKKSLMVQLDQAREALAR